MAGLAHVRWRNWRVCVCGIGGFYISANSGLKPYDYLVWLFSELPGLGEPQAVPHARLEAFAPWSPSVPESCRLRGGRDWPPEDRPLVDVDPHALDGD